MLCWQRREQLSGAAKGKVNNNLQGRVKGHTGFLAGWDSQLPVQNWGLRLRLPYVGHVVNRIALESFRDLVLWKFMTLVSLLHDNMVNEITTEEWQMANTDKL